MDTITIQFLKALGDDIAQRIIAEEGGDTQKPGGLYRTLMPEWYDDDTGRWVRPADWQHWESVRFIWRAMDATYARLDKTRWPWLQLGPSVVGTLKASLGTEDGRDERPIKYIWVADEQYALVRDLICFRVLEVLARSQQAGQYVP